MNRVCSIVVGVDFTPCSAAALKQAVRIAQWNQANLDVVHVIEMLVSTEVLNLRPLTQFQMDIQAGLVCDARASWDAFRHGMLGAEQLDLHVEVDDPLEAILRRVRQHRADLLVLGSHGLSPDRRTGTLATACVRQAMTKVMLVRDDHAGAFRCVVACIDFSETSRTALQQAVRVTMQEGAALHVLHVCDGRSRDLHQPASTGEVHSDHQMQYRNGLLRRLEEFGESLRHEMGELKPEYDLFESRSHGNGIMEFARQVEADLVILGTRGRSSLRDMLWGSTAERVVRHTTCSILAVPATPPLKHETIAPAEVR